MATKLVSLKQIAANSTPLTPEEFIAKVKKFYSGAKLEAINEAVKKRASTELIGFEEQNKLIREGLAAVLPKSPAQRKDLRLDGLA